MKPRRLRARGWRAIMAVPCAVALALMDTGSCSRAAEPDELRAAQALEGLLVGAIAEGESSVVAIARVPREAEARADAAAAVFPFSLPGQALAPTDPDFIPNEFGAGVLIDATGLVLTTQHVLGNPETSVYIVWLRKQPFRAEVLATSPWFDLAVLRLQNLGETPLQPIVWGDGSAIRKGQIVVALGNPSAIAREGSPSASWGIVSNLLRQAPRTPARSGESLGRETLHHFGTLIQTDARLTFGYSGGALLNLKGEMIGLTTSLTAVTGDESAAGLAIPVDEHFRRVVAALKRGDVPDFGFLGVSPEPLEPALRRRGFHGARVVSIVEGTPADQAGLRADDIITHINGEALADENDLFRHLGSLPAGSVASLKIARGDITDPAITPFEMQVALSKKYVRSARPAVGDASLTSWRGLQLDYATASPAFTNSAQRPPGDSLYVAVVAPDSSAWAAGIRVGDFVTHVGDSKVTTPRQFAQAVAGIASEVTLHVMQDGRRTTARTVSP